MHRGGNAVWNDTIAESAKVSTVFLFDHDAPATDLTKRWFSFVGDPPQEALARSLTLPPAAADVRFKKKQNNILQCSRHSRTCKLLSEQQIGAQALHS